MGFKENDGDNYQRANSQKQEASFEVSFVLSQLQFKGHSKLINQTCDIARAKAVIDIHHSYITCAAIQHAE